MRIAVLASHPVQYQAPIFRVLAQRVELSVFFAHRATPQDQAVAGFGVQFDWDVDLLSGFDHRFLHNVSPRPSLDRFAGCDTPSIHPQLREGNFDALLLMGWHFKSFWQGILAAKRLGIPVTVRGDSHLQTPRGLLKRVGKRLVYPGLLRVFDTALYVGERSRQYWKYYGYPSEGLFFSPHCIDNAWFAQRATAKAGRDLRRRHGIDVDAKVIVFAGKLVPFKRPLDLIATAVRLNSRIPKIVVLVAGSGPLEGEMVAAAKAGNVRVVHLGFCNQTEMPAVYAAADVLALPSDGRETWGLVTNESLACGTPIVVSDACGCSPDLAADGLVGRYFPMGDVDRFSDSLLAVLKAPPSRAMIQQKAADYSLDAATEGIVNACLSMANLRRRSR